MPISFTAILLLTCQIAAPVASAQEESKATRPEYMPSLHVTLQGGRTFNGIADKRTNKEQLWLRSGFETATITRPIPWSSIATISHDKQELDAAAVQELAMGDNGRNPPKAGHHWVEPGRIDIVHLIPAATPDLTKPAAIHSRPTMLRIDARVANFNGDAENDGLEVELQLLDQHGRTVPYQGTARIVWQGPQVRRNTADFPAQGIILGDWNVPVSSDGSSSSSPVQLPFQRSNPEFDNTLWNYSLVQATLTIPGVGNFSAEVDGIRVRRWEPYRDFQQVSPNGPLVNRSSRRP